MDVPMTSTAGDGKVRAIAGTSVLTIMLLLGGLFLLRAQQPAASGRLPSLPSLPEPAASCPSDREHALHAAQNALHAAQARLQRYAYAPRDGRHALERFGEAAECAQLAGDSQLLASITAQRSALRERIERDMRDHFRRYELLRQHERVGEATHDISYLTELGWPDRGPLGDQLRLDRERIQSAAHKEKP
jgi:hypothetical protein